MSNYSSPRIRIFGLQDGDIFWIRGERFILSSFADNKSKVYLTSLDRESTTFYKPIHVRGGKNPPMGYAVMSREKLYTILITKDYTIS